MKKRTKPDVRRIQGQLADTPVTRENRIYLTYVFARLVSPFSLVVSSNHRANQENETNAGISRKPGY